MVFKLLRIDTEEPCKIQLPIGTHLLGRGKFLDCNDKRVSRSHGELYVSDDVIIMRALHQNPCFFIKKDTNETQILKQNCETSLSNGDKFGLLPDAYWYEIVHCILLISKSQAEKQLEMDECNTEPLNNSTKYLTDSNKDNVNDEDASKTARDSDMNDTVDDGRCESPSLLSTGNRDVTDYDTVGTTSNTNFPNSNIQDSPAKRIHNSNKDVIGDGIKRIKTEPADTIPSDIKIEPQDNIPRRSRSPNNTSGSSINPVASSEDENHNSDKKTKDEPQTSASGDEGEKSPDAQPGPSKDKEDSQKKDDSSAKPKGRLRERCRYGANCYRKNIQHKADYSHPSDQDWGTGAQAPCPYGAQCFRRDPLHWRDHTHPPGTVPPPPAPHHQNRPGKERRKRKTQDSPPPSDLIVTGKRTRKTVRNNLTWSGSESENEYDMEDPYETDGSDDWEPSGDASQTTDYTQDTQEKSDDEN